MQFKLPITIAILSIFLLVGSFGVMAMSDHHQKLFSSGILNPRAP